MGPMGVVALGRRAIAQIILSSITASTGIPAAALQRTRLKGKAGAGAASTVTLAANTPFGTALEGFFDNCWIDIIQGPAAGDSRKVSGYVGSTRVATVSPAWSATPTTSSIYSVRHECEGLTAKAALIKVETAAVNLCIDGSVPTVAAGTNIGLQLDPGESIYLDDPQNVIAFRAINRVASSGSVLKVIVFA